MDRLINRMLAPLARRVANLIARGAVTAVDASGMQQRVQLRLLAGESKDAVEHFEPYGFTSNPLPGAEHLTLFLDGDRSHGVTVVVNDRRYRLTALPAGGVALYDPSGSYIKLLNDGNIQSAGTWVHDGDFLASGDVGDADGAHTLATMRTTYNAHRHSGSATPLPVM